VAVWEWEVAGAWLFLAAASLGTLVERAGGGDGPPEAFCECGEIYHASLRHRD
jgi:hypothetical protein